MSWASPVWCPAGISLWTMSIFILHWRLIWAPQEYPCLWKIFKIKVAQHCLGYTGEMQSIVYSSLLLSIYKLGVKPKQKVHFPFCLFMKTFASLDLLKKKKIIHKNFYHLSVAHNPQCFNRFKWALNTIHSHSYS